MASQSQNTNPEGCQAQETTEITEKTQQYSNITATVFQLQATDTTSASHRATAPSHL